VTTTLDHERGGRQMANRRSELLGILICVAFLELSVAVLAMVAFPVLMAFLLAGLVLGALAAAIALLRLRPARHG
jgi:hypothetical protein